MKKIRLAVIGTGMAWEHTFAWSRDAFHVFVFSKRDALETLCGIHLTHKGSGFLPQSL
ncbi:MAG: hypothetical protein PWQ70_2885 [Clostridiales bacterium]|nr:hypothetical protein [Clostridiales bacterium]